MFEYQVILLKMLVIQVLRDFIYFGFALVFEEDLSDLAQKLYLFFTACVGRRLQGMDDLLNNINRWEILGS